MNKQDEITIPKIIAGPILRHCQTSTVNIWLVTNKPYQISCLLSCDNGKKVIFDQQLTNKQLTQIAIGKNAYINLISLSSENFSQPLPEKTIIDYNLTFSNNYDHFELTQQLPDLVYAEHTKPNFIVSSTVENLLHGSCRKPHFDSKDGLSQVDKKIATTLKETDKRPSLLIMSGDQVYCDDVAGPTLNAIEQVIELLGLFDDLPLPTNNTAEISSTHALFESPNCYYHREKILPTSTINSGVIDTLFNGLQQPIFSSVNAKNHLISLPEVIAMYLLVWSPQLWQQVNLNHTDKIPEQELKTYNSELIVIKKFVAELSNVQRALAHIPCYMIFDDHDVTDDWNLTRAWEEAAYSNEFSKRIIGNALAGYFLCQGWGNSPKQTEPLTALAKSTFTANGLTQYQDFIDALYKFNQWHYQLETSPKILVLDTRTQRWRSESNANKPSGLMDWESLCNLQQSLINESSVILVSAAPIYGVKLIETVQRIFTFFGKPLMVDAENWMAHSGTANVILNIFRHHNTPPNFIILSGDVHYSFVYRVTHRFIRSSSTITQITCSGIKNAFPDGLLHTLEKLNRYLYATYSPLNWFTKRRRMKIRVQKPNNSNYNTLYNGSGIGLLTLDSEQNKVTAKLLTVDDKEIDFN